MEQMYGKSKLIIVGNGPSSLYKPIDSYDKVTRIGCFELIDGTGTKTDIVVRRSWQPVHDVDETWMIEPVISRDKIIEGAKRLGSKKYAALIKKLNLPDNMHPSSGMSAIEMAVQFYGQTHTIDICGFDGFNNGWYWDNSHIHVTSDILHSPIYERMLIMKYKDKQLLRVL